MGEGPKIISTEDREAYFNSYNHTDVQTQRFLFGCKWYLWYRLTRWWNLRPDVGFLQICSLFALLALATIAAVGAVEALHAPTEWKPWLNPVAAVCAGVVALYKVVGKNAVSDHEALRRDAVASLVHEIGKAEAIDRKKMDGQHDKRLKEICICVRQDIEERLQIATAAVDVLLLAFRKDENATGGHGKLERAMRDREQPGGFFSKPRVAMEAFVYEALRKTDPRTRCFHDIRSAHFRKYFGDIDTNYRTVFCVPVVDGATSEPVGIMTIKLKQPFVLWPYGDMALDRRLLLYAEFAAIFMPRPEDGQNVNA